MSVTVKVNCYSDLCDSYMYGKRILELPNSIIDAIDDYFDGREVDFSGGGNPDDVYVNYYCSEDPKTALVELAGLVTNQEYYQLVESDSLDSYIEEHEEKIAECLNEDCYYLGYAGREFHFFSGW